MEKATFGGGCFWCIEAPLQLLSGVHSVTSGYAGGFTKMPTYNEVCSGVTGHAEVVQVEFNPDEVSYAKLLEVFFTVHDPTTPNRQGADIGTQYRSIILFHNKEQEEIAGQLISELNNSGVYGNPLVTQVAPIGDFYPAEAYHQNYYRSNPGQPYCSFIIKPKIERVKQLFASFAKS